MQIFKIQYDWYEGEHNETLVAKDVEDLEFEKDILEARAFAESLKGIEIKDYDYLGKGYSVECLPQFYEQIIWFLVNKKGYLTCFYDNEISYDIGEDIVIEITKVTAINQREVLKPQNI